MYVICSRCKEYIGEKEPYEQKDESNTICPTCTTKSIKKKNVLEVIIGNIKNPFTPIEILKSYIKEEK